MATTAKQFGPMGWTPERLGSLDGNTYVVTACNNDLTCLFTLE